MGCSAFFQLAESVFSFSDGSVVEKNTFRKLVAASSLFVVNTLVSLKCPAYNTIRAFH